MNLFSRLARRLRDGTLMDAVRRRMGRMPEHVHVRWYGARDLDEAMRAMTRWARDHVRPVAGSRVLTVGDDDPYRRGLNERLQGAGIAFRTATLDEARAWPASEFKDVRAVLAAFQDARRLTAAARFAAQHPQLGLVPFEYVSGLNPERASFERLDQYADTHFVSPVLLEQPSPYELYQESLRHFEQKCGLRDFLDLYQWIRQMVVNGVPGDIAEFGSYKGHSGWLIARTLQALGSDKRLYMFDMFEAFPDETVGVDHFWSRTHKVDYAEVQGKFRDLPMVTLVKGDFTRTLDHSGLKTVALAYVDCDSYRATRYLFDTLWPSMLSINGAFVCEDYGHPALLGNRAAVHESLGQVGNGLHFFSQFSGLHISIKTRNT